MTKKVFFRSLQKFQFFTQIPAKLHGCTIKFQCQIWPVITGLLLLAAYFWPSGDSYDQSGVFMVPWEASSKLCVLLKSCGAR